MSDEWRLMLVCLSVPLLVCQSVCLSFCLSVCLAVYLTVCLGVSMSLSVCLSELKVRSGSILECFWKPFGGNFGVPKAI